jgi:hypothetical protein
LLRHNFTSCPVCNNRKFRAFWYFSNHFSMRFYIIYMYRNVTGNRSWKRNQTNIYRNW